MWPWTRPFPLSLCLRGLFVNLICKIRLNREIYKVPSTFALLSKSFPFLTLWITEMLWRFREERRWNPKRGGEGGREAYWPTPRPAAPPVTEGAPSSPVVCLTTLTSFQHPPLCLLWYISCLLLIFPEALPTSLPSPVPGGLAPWKQQLCPHCRVTALPLVNLLCWLSHSKVLNTDGLLHAPSSGVFIYSSILNPCNFGHSLGRNLGAARHI